MPSHSQQVTEDMTDRFFYRILPLGILFLAVTALGGLSAGNRGMFSHLIQSDPIQSDLARHAHSSTEESRSNDLRSTQSSVPEWLPPRTCPDRTILEASASAQSILDDGSKFGQTEVPQLIALVSDAKLADQKDTKAPALAAPDEPAQITEEVVERIPLNLAPRTELSRPSPPESPSELRETPPNDSRAERSEQNQTDEEPIKGPDLGYEPSEPSELSDPLEPSEPIAPSESSKRFEPKRLESVPTRRAPDAVRDPSADEPRPDEPRPHEPRPHEPIEPISKGPRVRSQSLELAAREADVHSRRGFELAGRKAYFAAKAEFIRALRLIAQALDIEMQTSGHRRALAAGLTAMKESEAFLPRGRKLEADLDIVGIIQDHRTPVLHDATIGTMTPLAAVGTYLTYAQEQLAMAVDSEISGSMALLGLGKLHAAMSEESAAMSQAARPKAIAIFQASLLAHPKNSMASNDLGVLLARVGRFEDARLALEHSLSIRQGEPTGWRNLAIVYQQLKRIDLAQRALLLAENSRHGANARLGHLSNTPQGQIRWVAPVRFARAGGQTLPPIPAPTHSSPAVRNPSPPMPHRR